MARWSLTSAPSWVTSEDCVLTHRGWEGVTTGEIYVAIPRGSSKAGASAAAEVYFVAASLTQGAALSVKTRFSQPVDVTAGSSIVVSSTQGGGDITLYAAAQSGVSEVVYNKQVDNATNQLVPSSVAASRILTLTGLPLDTETVTIGAKTYTFQDTLTNVDGNVKIGVDANVSLLNLVAAIMLGAGSGSAYAAATTAHPTASAAMGVGDTMVVTALTAGAGGNALASTDTLTNGSFPGVTFTGGVTNSGTLSIGAQTLGGTIVESNRAVAATATLTLSGQPLNTETVVLGSRTYTFQTTLTNVDGNVKIGASADESLANLIAAVNLTGVAGTNYAASMTIHAAVSALDADQNSLDAVFKAKTAGTGGNSLDSTETLTNGGFGGVVFSGGAAATAATKVISAPVAAAAGTRVIA